MLARGVAAAIASVVIITPAATFASSGPGHSSHRLVPQTAAASAARPLFRFVSIPDFPNADIGDVSRLPRWHKGDANSINASWRRALAVVLDQVRAEHPKFVLVGGDVVEGRWLLDATGYRFFGPTRTRAERLHVVSVAGGLYFGQYRHRFAVRGLRLLPALGDHEIGNDPWPIGSLKEAAVPIYKRAFADAFTRHDGRYIFSQRPRGTQAEGTAYAVRVADTMVVTVDDFRPTLLGVKLTVAGRQLRWLGRVLRHAWASGVDHIIVQGHLPVLPPPTAVGSSRLVLAGGASSAFWRLLQRYHVDLYLAGEFHAPSVMSDGVVQVVHGSLTWKAMQNYVLGLVYPDRIVLVFKQFTGHLLDTSQLWQYQGAHCSAHLRFDPRPVVVRRYVVVPR